MLSKKIVIGNWKMNPIDLKEAVKTFKAIQNQAKGIKKTEIVVAPPYLYLRDLKKISRKVKLGAQNVYPGSVGSQTGEVSALMLKNLGVVHSVVGHSERRAMGETNEFVNQKIKSLLSTGIIPILCVGESERDPEHSYLGFIKTQIEDCLQGVSKTSLNQIIIAYEPIWAIGKDAVRPATAPEFLEMSIFIKKVLNDKFGTKNIEGIRIVYGGSTTPQNAYNFIIEGNADGFLVGRDSLTAQKFIEIIKITENAKR